MRLATALVAFIIAPLIGLIAIGTWFSLQTLEAGIEQRKQEESALIARAISQPLSYSLELGRIGAVRESLETAFEFDRVYGAHIFGPDGRLIASAGAGRSEQPPPPEGLPRGEDDRERRGAYERVKGEQVYNYFVPLTGTGGRVLGMLQISRRGAEFGTALARLRIGAVTALIAIGLMVTAIILVAHRRLVGRPIQDLVAAMQRFAEGERGIRAPSHGPGEIRSLSDGLNNMLGGIETSEAEIDERRRREDMLERDLRHSQKLAAIGALATGLAHELGTPLSVVDGRAQRLLRLDDETGSVGREAAAIRAEVARMEGTIRQLMDFAGRNPVRLSPEPLDRLANLAVATLAEASQPPAATIDIADDGPAPVVPVDRNRLHHALVNLLNNASQAAGSGGHVLIGWFGDPEPGLYIDDDGPGVPEAMRSRIFEPFYTSKGVAEGTGLGLAVVHGTVEDHGASIHVSASPILGGARFEMRFADAAQAFAENDDERDADTDPSG